MNKKDEINKIVKEMILGWERMERMNIEYRNWLSTLDYFPWLEETSNWFYDNYERIDHEMKLDYDPCG